MKWYCALVTLAAGSIFFANAVFAAGEPSADAEAEGERGAAGLVARFIAQASTEVPQAVERIEPVPRLFGRPGETPDDTLPAGQFTAEWTGLLLVPYGGQYTFTTQNNSLDEFSLTVSGHAVERGKSIALEPGLASFRLAGKQNRGEPALDLWWRCEVFADEPIDARFFRHDPAIASQAATASFQRDAGAVLAKTHGCFHCHPGPAGRAGAFAADNPAGTALNGPRLDRVGARVQSAWLLAWLKQPAAWRPHVGMPALFGDQPADELAARTIAAFLAADNAEPTRVRETADPLPEAARKQHGEALYQAAGCAACHAPSPNAAGPAHLTSTAPSLDGLSAKWTPHGLADFIEQPLTTRSHGRMPDFHFSAEESADIATYLLTRPAKGKKEFRPLAPIKTEELAAQWKSLQGNTEQFKVWNTQQRLAAVAVNQMAARQCFDCHDMERSQLKIVRAPSRPARIVWTGSPVKAPISVAPSLAGLGGEQARRGCLAPAGHNKAAPRYDLADEQRANLVAYFSGLKSEATASTMTRLRIDLALLNCLRCHDNEGQGGQSLAALVNEGDSTKHYLPPMLTGVAGRVRPARLEAFVTQGARQKSLRPWTAARMPGFGPHGNRLAVALEMRDGILWPSGATMLLAQRSTAPTIQQPELQSQHVDLGRKLVGTKALACINCHTLHGALLAGQPDPTTRAPELTLVAEHLRPEYFYRWMTNPARIRPGTKMPQAIGADGRVPLPALAAQPPGTAMNALWSYLSQGGSALPPEDARSIMARPLPAQPAVQRGTITVGGKLTVPRGMALGFVDGTLLFDADRLSPAAVWHGGFVKSTDARYFGLVWANEGEAVDDFSAQPHPLSVRWSENDPWHTTALPLETDANAGARFEGYQVGKTSVRLRYRLLVDNQPVEVAEDVRLQDKPEWHGVARHFRFYDLPVGAQVALALPPGKNWELRQANGEPAGGVAVTAPLAICQDEPLRVVRVEDSLGGDWVDAPLGPQKQWISARAKAGQPVEIRVDCWTYRAPDASTVREKSPTAAQLASLHVNRPVIDDDFDREPASPAPLPQAPAAEPTAAPTLGQRPKRAAVLPHENIDEFPPTKARYLRFTITRTQDNQAPGLDELEVFGPDHKLNLALAGTATASSVVPGVGMHQIKHLNDGKFGNKQSWIGAEPGKGWAQIEFPATVEIGKVVWARDRHGRGNNSGLPVDYRIEVSQDGETWAKVIDGSDRLPPPQPGIVHAEASPGYVMDALPLPFDGCRISDVAFGNDDALYVLAMTEGQVWYTRRPPPDRPAQVRWRRYASGLHQPMGLATVNGRLYVAQKPEITELIDRDGDGEADAYRAVTAAWGLWTGYHEFTFGLGVDPEKNLWFTLNTGFFWPANDHTYPGRFRGSILRLQYCTEKLEVMATGCRVPNGITRGPGGDMFFTDNQGDWIQNCKLAAVVPGCFYGHPERKEDALPEGQYPDGRAAVWLPYQRSRSASGPVHDDTGGKFGVFAGQMFVGDAGYGANPGILRVALEKVDDEYQGAVFRFVDDQPHGCERMKFGPDNELYMACLTTGLARLRPDGNLPFAMHSLHIRPRGEGFVVQLTRPLAADTNLTPADVRVKRYHYLYSSKYGSPAVDEKAVPVTAVNLSADRMTIALSLPVETYPIGMVYEFNLANLKADNGQPLVHNEAWYTVHRIPQ